MANGVEKGTEENEEAVPLLDEKNEVAEDDNKNSSKNINDEIDAKETGNPQEDPPPTYNSLFGKLKTCQEETANTFDFLHTSADILLKTTGCTLMLAVLLALPITAIIIGSTYKEDCPKQRYIPIYLIVFGSFSICRQLLEFLTRCGKEEVDGEKHLNCDCCKCLECIVSVFLMCWFIAGNVWIYRAYEPNYTDAKSEEFCNKTLYLFAFWMTTAFYILFASFCCFLGCIACCWMCWGDLEDRSNTPRR